MIYSVVGIETGKLVKDANGKPLVFKDREVAYRWYRNNGYSDTIRIVAIADLSEENRGELIKSLNENLFNKNHKKDS